MSKRLKRLLTVGSSTILFLILSAVAAAASGPPGIPPVPF